ncbi:MAG: amidohydrolase family protein [Actinomycetota bacterium]|nr:amidohydrolase family protein [Actinomycetota bacterium]
MLDLVIRNGELVDGTGAARRRADVGVSGGRIVEIGAVADRGRREIDAEGRIVAPGFVDVHTHFDAQVFWDPTLSPSPLHGVTTVMAGNCGFTIAPLAPSQAGFLKSMLARVEGMPIESLDAGVPWDWTSTAEYLERIDGSLAVNAGFMVGHSALRRVVMGEAGSERVATEDEVAAMCAMLGDGLAAGAVGFSTSRSRTHNDASGEPVPSRVAHPDELIALAAVCRQFPGTSLEYIPDAAPVLSDEDVDLMARMSAAAERPLNWNLLLVRVGNEDEVAGKLASADYAASRRGRVVPLTMPVNIPVRFSFATGAILDMIPGWEHAMALPVKEKLALLRNRDERAHLERLAAASAGRVGVANWADKAILETQNPELRRFEGRMLTDIAAETGGSEFDALCDIVCQDELRTLFSRAAGPETAGDWKARVEVWRDGRAVIGASDAGAHLDLLATFNYTTLLLEHAVREHQALPLEEAVHYLTQVPADLYGLSDRGRVAVGARADVIVLDEATVGSDPISMRYDLPASAGRLYADAHGIDHVVVNGEEIVSGGSFTEARPGGILRSGRDTTTPAMA